MSKRPSFMQRFGSQHGNSSQTLLRSARNHFYTTIPLIWGRTSRKRLVLVRFEVLGQFSNTSTVHYNILVRIWRIYRIKFKCRYLQNQKLFLDFLLLQWNLRWTLSILKKKISLRAKVLPKLLTAKLVATEMSKRPSFMQRFGSQDGNGSPTLLRSAGNHFYTAIPLIWGRTSRKRLVLVRYEVLGQFANKSTVHYKYSR